MRIARSAPSGIEGGSAMSGRVAALYDNILFPPSFDSQIGVWCPRDDDGNGFSRRSRGYDQAD